MPLMPISYPPQIKLSSTFLERYTSHHEKNKCNHNSQNNKTNNSSNPIGSTVLAHSPLLKGLNEE